MPIQHGKILDILLSATTKSESLANRVILVTGASGMIGLCVIAFALARGATVCGMYHSRLVDFAHPRLRWIKCDLNGEPDSTFTGKVDIMIHTAALWLFPKAWTKFPLVEIDRVIAFGSTSIFSKMGTQSRAEQAMINQLLDAEKSYFALARSANATLFRPTMIYGLGLDANISRLAKVIQFCGVLPVYGDASGLRQPVQAMDLAKAALDVVDVPATFGKTYNLGGGEVLSYRSMIDRLFRYLGRQPFVLRVPFLAPMLDLLEAIFPSSNINGEMLRRMNRDLVFDLHPAADDFRYSPAGFLEGTILF